MDIVRVDQRAVISLINKIAEEATLYGGDTGGPYCVDPNRLRWALERMVEALDADETYEVRDIRPHDNWGWTLPQIVKKEDMDR